MNPLILAHAGGIDEMGIIVLPAVMVFGTWMLTRRRQQAGTTPNYSVAQVTSGSPSSNGVRGVAQPGWKQSSERATVWTNPGSSKVG